MKNPKSKKIKTSIKNTSASPRNRKEKLSGDKVEELFGVHLFNEADIENHFGTSEEKRDGESKNKNPK